MLEQLESFQPASEEHSADLEGERFAEALLLSMSRVVRVPVVARRRRDRIGDERAAMGHSAEETYTHRYFRYPVKVLSNRMEYSSSGLR